MPVLFQSNQTETILCQGNVERLFFFFTVSLIEDRMTLSEEFD